MKHKNLAAMTAIMAMMGMNTGAPQKGRIFGVPRGNSLGPGTGPGSGRLARCRRCGAQGRVIGTHDNGQRKIEGCSCA